MLIPKTAGCGDLGNWAEAKGYYIPWNGTPKVGDLILFDFTGKHNTRNRQHVGVLVAMTGDTMTTIEGNTSVTSDDNGGAVMRRVRTRSQVACFIRVPYTGSQTAARLLAIAAAQVGVKERPTGSNNVKYNTWFYGHAVSGDAYPWCCAFVAWCFAVLAGEIDEDGGDTVMVEAKRLARGASGSPVKKLQILLIGLGHGCGKSGADGDFGGKTEEAVRAFQKAAGLEPDGVVGALTWGKLIN